MRYLAIISCAFLSACNNPVFTNGQGISMPDDLRIAYELADYKQHQAIAIRFTSLGNLSGRYLVSERIVEINSSLRNQDDKVLAGIIAHELHHSNGFIHDCADGLKDSNKNGAWEIHALTLDRLGVEHSIRENQFCF